MTAVATKTRADVLFRALSDRTRLRLLHLIKTGETCVCDLVDVLHVPQPKVSRHLAYLRRAGLVSARKDGLWSYYSLAPAQTELHEKLLDCLCCCFKDVPELAGDVRQLRRRKAGRCC